MKRPANRGRDGLAIGDALKSCGKVGAVALRESEWNFRPLIHKNPTQAQREELRAAILYEYARESDSIRRLASAYGKLPGPQATAADLLDANPEALSDFTLIPFWNCIFWPDYFPEKPWLEIPPQKRTQRVQTFVKWQQETLLKINEWDELAPYETPKRGGRCIVGGGENLILWLNWASANNSEIVDAFASWVRASRPKNYPEPRGDASRENVTAALLTRLAVMRLLHHCPHLDALKLEDSKMKMPMQQSKALRMRREAEKDFRRLFQSEVFENVQPPTLIPPHEFPRSWMTFSQRKKVRS